MPRVAVGLLVALLSVQGWAQPAPPAGLKTAPAQPEAKPAELKVKPAAPRTEPTAKPVAPKAESVERRIEPRDEALRDPSWAIFRARLLEALAKRDRAYVLGILDRNVRNGSDRPRGVAEFRRQWDLDARDSPVWRTLFSALGVGSAWLKRDKRPPELCAPYVLAAWPRDVDPTTYGVMTSREALVKSEPSHDAQTLGTLSYSIVRVTDWEVPDEDKGFPQKWVRIWFKDQIAFVPEEQIRSPVEHAACFVRTPAGWRMTVFGPAGRD